MVRVIENGKNKTYVTTCKQCDSTFEYTKDEVFYTKKEERGGVIRTIPHLFRSDEHYVLIEENKYECIKCPVCGAIRERFCFDELPQIKRWERIGIKNK